MGQEGEKPTAAELAEAPRLYKVLGLTKKATPNEVKRAYYDAAQRYHPDRGGPKTDEARFKEAQGAYEILKDENNRKVYDRYGEKGLKMISMGGDQAAAAALQAPAMIACAFIALVIPVLIQLIFVSLRVDEHVHWSIVNTLIPLWTGFALVGCFVSCILVAVVGSREQPEDEQQQSKCKQITEVLHMAVYVVCLFMFFLLAALKMDENINHGLHGSDKKSYKMAFIPLFILMVMALVQAKDLRPAAYDATCRLMGVTVSRKGYIIYVFRSVLAYVVTLVTFILVLLRMDEDITCTWFVVLIPEYVEYLINAVFLFVEKEREQPIGTIFIQLLVGAIMPLQFSLIIWNEENKGISMAVALIPAWIIMALSLCVPCCLMVCAPDMSEFATLDSDDEEAEAEAAGEKTPMVDHEAAGHSDHGATATSAPEHTTFDHTGEDSDGERMRRDGSTYNPPPVAEGAEEKPAHLTAQQLEDID